MLAAVQDIPWCQSLFSLITLSVSYVIHFTVVTVVYSRTHRTPVPETPPLPSQPPPDPSGRQPDEHRASTQSKQQVKDTALAWLMPTKTAMQRMTLAHSRLNLWGSPRWLSMQGYSRPTTAAREGTPLVPAARQWLSILNISLACKCLRKQRGAHHTTVSLIKHNYYPPFLL